MTSYLLPLWTFVGLMWIIWSIIAIELTLFWNGATGIYDISSTGQLIPFIIGILSLFGLFQVTVTGYLRENYVRKAFHFVSLILTAKWSPVLYYNYKLKFNDTNRKARLVMRRDLSISRRRSFELPISIPRAERENAASSRSSTWCSRYFSRFKSRKIIFAATEDRLPYWESLPVVDGTPLCTKLSPLDQVLQLYDAWGACRQDPKDSKAFHCFRKDLVRNIRRYLREDRGLLEVPDFKSLRQALE